MKLGSVANLIREHAINSTNNSLNKSLERLSTGLRINRSSDDAIGLAISDRLRNQSVGVKQSIENANSAIAMMTIADKGMDELSKILDTIKSKAIQMNTDTTSDDGRKIIKTDILALIEQYDNIVCSTDYNGVPLLTGCASPFHFQVGNNLDNVVSVNIDNLSAKFMGDEAPYKLKNFITGFEARPVVVSPPTIGDINSGIVLQNGLDNRVPYNSNPAGNFMIEVPAGTKDFTVYLYDNGANDTIQIFTKDGAHVAGTPSGHSSWDTGNTPENIITQNPDKFNTGATYSNDLTRYTLNSAREGLGSNSVNYIDKLGQSRVYNLEQYDEMVVIPEVTENLVIFINGQGAYYVSAECKHEEINNKPNNVMCGCDTDDYTRNDDEPDLKTQAQILMNIVDLALSQLNSQRKNAGVGINQLESTVRSNMKSHVNVKDAESTLRDLDYAAEMTNFNRLNVTSQAGSFLHAQANDINKQFIMSLLR